MEAIGVIWVVVVFGGLLLAFHKKFVEGLDERLDGAGVVQAVVLAGPGAGRGVGGGEMIDHGTFSDFVVIALVAIAVFMAISVLAASMLSSQISRREEEWHGR